MRSPPFDDRVRESLAAIVDVNNQLAYHLAVCESDDPGISFESRVDHELPRKTGMDGAHVPYRGPDVIGGRVDRHFLANGSHLPGPPYHTLIGRSWGLVLGKNCGRTETRALRAWIPRS